MANLNALANNLSWNGMNNYNSGGIFNQPNIDWNAPPTPMQTGGGPTGQSGSPYTLSSGGYFNQPNIDWNAPPTPMQTGGGPAGEGGSPYTLSSNSIFDVGQTPSILYGQQNKFYGQTSFLNNNQSLLPNIYANNGNMQNKGFQTNNYLAAQFSPRLSYNSSSYYSPNNNQSNIFGSNYGSYWSQY